MTGDLGNHDLDVPFEEGPEGPLLDENVHYSGGVVVMAGTVDVPEVGVMPSLVFRFTTPLGEFYPAIVLVTDDDQMAKLRPLLMEAIATARRVAKTGGSSVGGDA